ncbi:MAG: hypothetical protein LBC74_12715 [Planctomycetaceae bacterium]|jgi:archaellum component FlaC|nr:hypothetical protein [Planctomycetaceae bacterium]
MNATISNIKGNDAGKLFAELGNLKTQAIAFDDLTGTNEATKQIEQLESVFIDKFKNMKASTENLKVGLQEFGKMAGNVDINLISPEKLQNIEDFKNAIKDMAGKAEQSLDGLKPNLESLNKAIAKVKEIQGLNVSFNKITGDTNGLGSAVANVVEGYKRLAEATADNIKNMNPTVEGIRNAVREYNRLQDSINEARRVTGDQDLGAKAIQQATDNLYEYQQTVAESQLQTQLLNSTIFALQNMSLE